MNKGKEINSKKALLWDIVQERKYKKHAGKSVLSYFFSHIRMQKH